MASKEELKIRLTREQKQLIKRVSKLEGLTMSDFILHHIEPIAMSKEYKLTVDENINKRIATTENKIIELREKLNERRNNSRTRSNRLKYIFKNS